MKVRLALILLHLYHGFSRIKALETSLLRIPSRSRANQFSAKAWACFTVGVKLTYFKRQGGAKDRKDGGMDKNRGKEKCMVGGGKKLRLCYLVYSVSVM